MNLIMRKSYIIFSLIVTVAVKGCSQPISSTQTLLDILEQDVLEQIEILEDAGLNELLKVRSSSISETLETEKESIAEIEVTIPLYEGNPVTVLNNNIPLFTESQKEERKACEKYENLDLLGRATGSFAILGLETLPTEERGSIGQIKPSGWHTVKYPEVIEDLYLYNRCHLIAYCLSGENANEKNLVTGTRAMNLEMVSYEIMVAEYIEESGNHVLYRATPLYEGNDLVAKGIQLEAYSMEDKGEGIQFNVFIHNIQDGIEIDYTTGESKLSHE